jgi:N-methylhydantoinase A
LLRRSVAFDRKTGPVDTPVWPRDAVPADGVHGPLIVESYDSTVVVPPGAHVARDVAGHLVITLP